MMREYLAGIMVSPLGLVWGLLKDHLPGSVGGGDLDLLSAEELGELSALGGHDPDVVEHYLGARRLLAPSEAEEISHRMIDAQMREEGSSHPEGISYQDNVGEYERDTGGRALNLGEGVRGAQTPTGIWGGPNDALSPQIIGNMPWPLNFTTDNKGDPMVLALRLLKGQYIPSNEPHPSIQRYHTRALKQGYLDWMGRQKGATPEDKIALHNALRNLPPPTQASMNLGAHGIAGDSDMGPFPGSVAVMPRPPEAESNEAPSWWLDNYNPS